MRKKFRPILPCHRIRRRRTLIPTFTAWLLISGFSAQSQEVKRIAASLPDAPRPQAITAAPNQNQNQDQNQDQSLGNIGGRVVDPNGNFVFAAKVRLTREGQTAELEVATDKEGQFVFSAVAPGTFELTVSAVSFGPQQRQVVLHPGETLELPEIALPVGAAVTEVTVSVTRYELAEEQIKVEETQRVLGVFPNFYVTYRQDTLPLATKQKFELAWKSAVDPVTIAATGVVAGVEQANDGFSGYGQGAQGYAKRYGASYADGFIGNMIGGAILPSLLKQDPRYFYKGTGGVRKRVLYALANAVICKGDNGHWQFDYSGVLGSLAAGGISNLYYPESSRNGLGLTFQNTAIGIGSSGISNLLQEFLIRRLTPHARDPKPNNP